MTRRLLVAAVLVVLAVPVGAQTSSAPHSGGFSPFRARDFGGAGDFNAVSIVQEDCPIDVNVASVGRDDRGVVFTVKVTNTAGDPAPRHTLAVWAFGPDGTLRGSQQQRQSKALAAGETRHIDLALRTMAVKTGDRLVVAVQEVWGDAPWKKDMKALEAEVRSAIFP
jgi:hypothetical protein